MPDTINLSVTLHPKQAEVFTALRDTSLREVVLRKGRRFGGTFVTALATTEFAIANPTSPYLKGKPTEISYYGPIYENAKRVYREVIDSFGAALADTRESDLSLVWHGGARGKCYSGEKLGGTLGSGNDIAVVDEASNFPGQLIRSHIIPTLTDRRGRLFQVSSPRHGRLNHFSQRALKAEAREIPGVVGFHATSFDNPNLDRDWLEAQRTDPDMDERTWQEEWLALILDSSACWLDPSQIQVIDSDKIPTNTFNTLQSDFAWGKPEAGMIEEQSRARKDANVLAVFSQDMLGNVYLRRDGLYKKYCEPDEAFDKAATLIRQYDIRRFSVERDVNVMKTVDDMFGRLWRDYMDKHNVPRVGMVRPHRKGGWKTPAIRRWSALLSRGKFYVEAGSVLHAPLADEMMQYSETAAAKDRCHDDALVAASDVMLPGIYQGGGNERAVHDQPGKDIFFLREAYERMGRGGWDNAAEPRRSRYGPT